jgi:hypothetical protein
MEFMGRSGQAADERATDRLSAAGADVADIPALRREAAELLDQAAHAARVPGGRQERQLRGGRS